MIRIPRLAALLKARGYVLVAREEAVRSRNELARLGRGLVHERAKVAKLKVRLEVASGAAVELERRRRAALAEQDAVDQAARTWASPLEEPAPDAITAWPRLRFDSDVDRPSIVDGPTKPLRAFVAGAQDSLFDFIRRPDVVVDRALTPGAAPTHLVIARPLDLDRQAALAPAELWERIRLGLATLVFDASGEGVPHRPGGPMTSVHRFLAQRQIAPAQAVYVTQDRGFAAAYGNDPISFASGPVRSLVYDLYVRWAVDGVDAGGDARFRRGLEAHLSRGVEPLRFLSFNHKVRPLRVLLLLRLLAHGFWDDGLISFGGFEAGLPQGRGADVDEYAQILRSLDGFQDAAEPVLSGLGPLSAMGRIMLSVTDGQQSRVRVDDLAAYRETAFSVVTETEMSDRVHRITEKPLKALLSFHPMILFGSYRSLTLLKGYGFRTFDGFVDEGYDEEPDPRRRFELAYAELERLCRMDRAELSRLVESALETVVFNARWGLCELPRIFREQIDPDFLRQLGTTSRGEKGVG